LWRGVECGRAWGRVVRRRGVGRLGTRRLSRDVLNVYGACVDEPAAYAIRTCAECVEGLADLRLVLRMACNRSLFVSSVGKLALDSIAARVGLHE